MGTAAKLERTLLAIHWWPLPRRARPVAALEALP